LCFPPPPPHISFLSFNVQNVDGDFVLVSSQMINTFLKKFKAKIEKGKYN